MASDGFGGFPAETLKFLRGIDERNAKAWFEQNRDLYEAGYVAPARAFVEDIGPRLRKISPGVQFEARVNGSIGRINRDVRFSKDKRPYKNHLDIWFWHGGRKGWDCPGFYLRIAPTRIFLGSGMHGFEGKLLDDFRRAVVSDAAGARLMAAINAVDGQYEIGGETRKSVPRGFDADHPRARFLRHEGLYAGIELPAAIAEAPDFAEQALAHFAATWPIGKWLLEDVTHAG
ncbi:DUF2461 domain-containing protein [Mesorhizobium sp. CC13]|uniref:DUF2461 domain-containing protein n=1 Tax=Mesorhizobium sp. CC13 TaxID=3029194 RepID=UPI003267C853